MRRVDDVPRCCTGLPSSGVPGCKYRLYSRDGDEVSTYETLAWNWQVGDVLGDAQQPRPRIVSILDLDESDDSSGAYQAVFMVELADGSSPSRS